MSALGWEGGTGQPPDGPHWKQPPTEANSPECVEDEFCELRCDGVLRSSPVRGLRGSRTFAAVAFVVDDHLSPIRQQQRHLPDYAHRRRQ